MLSAYSDAEYIFYNYPNFNEKWETVYKDKVTFVYGVRQYQILWSNV